MKKSILFSIIFTISILALLSSNSVLANDGGIIEFGPYTETVEFQELADSIINFIFKIAVFIVPLIILIGAFFLVIAGGDTKKIDQGKKLIFWAIIGFALILLSRGIVTLIEQLIE